MLVPLLIFGIVVVTYFQARKHFGVDSLLASGLRILIIAALCVPLTMIASTQFLDVRGEDAGKSIIFGAFFAGLLASALNHPMLRTALTVKLGAGPTPAPTADSSSRRDAVPFLPAQEAPRTPSETQQAQREPWQR